MDTDLDQFNCLNLDEINQKIDDLEKEQKLADDALSSVEDKDTELSLQALDIQRQRKELKIIISKARMNVRQLTRLLNKAKRYYWKVKA